MSQRTPISPNAGEWPPSGSTRVDRVFAREYHRATQPDAGLRALIPRLGRSAMPSSESMAIQTGRRPWGTRTRSGSPAEMVGG